MIGAVSEKLFQGLSAEKLDPNGPKPFHIRCPRTRIRICQKSCKQKHHSAQHSLSTREMCDGLFHRRAVMLWSVELTHSVIEALLMQMRTSKRRRAEPFSSCASCGLIAMRGIIRFAEPYPTIQQRCQLRGRFSRLIHTEQGVKVVNLSQRVNCADIIDIPLKIQPTTSSR